MKKLLVTRKFKDLQEDVFRQIDEQFEAENDRAEELLNKGFVTELDEDGNPVVREEKEPEAGKAKGRGKTKITKTEDQ